MREGATILAIETSCDESAAAVVRVGAVPQVLHEVLSSQIALHIPYGGVVPELAARAHLSSLPLLIDEVMERSSVSFADLSGIAVTRGPGLKGCLLMGCQVAIGLRAAYPHLQLVGVNHIEGHLWAPVMDNPGVQPPFLALVVSGGHTELQLVEGLGRSRCIARTRDDAAGEAFDKAAALLGIPYPGGAALSALARKASGPGDVRLPTIMPGSLEMSFSGLKTAISLAVRDHGPEPLSEERRATLAFAVEQAIVATLVTRVRQACQETGLRTVVVTGGVSANTVLREKIAALPRITSYVASPLHCTDNAAMIGYVGALRFFHGEGGSSLGPIESRWPVEELLPPGQ